MNIAGRIVTATHSRYPRLVREQKLLFFTKRVDGASLFKPTNALLDVLSVRDESLRGLVDHVDSQLRAGIGKGSAIDTITSATCGR